MATVKDVRQVFWSYIEGEIDYPTFCKIMDDIAGVNQIALF